MYATRDYNRYLNENEGEDDGEYNMDDYEEAGMEEEEVSNKNQPDEDGWVVVQ